MTTQHPIRCPQCGLDRLEPHFTGPVHSPAALTAFTCTRCGHRWQAFETPQFPAPDYLQAYGTAPDLAEEEIVLGLWAEGINTRAQAARANSSRAVDGGGYRLFYLRQAAYLDRAAREMELALYCRLVAPKESMAVTSAAGESAALLLHLDLDLGQVHVEGPFGPSCPEWQAPGGSRAYVRQEYTAWQEWEVGARRRRARRAGRRPRPAWDHAREQRPALRHRPLRPEPSPPRRRTMLLPAGSRAGARWRTREKNMIIWINGPFGGGKSTNAALLHQQLDGSVVTDPEDVGFLLRKSLADHLSRQKDFQDYPMWRTLVARVCTEMDRHTAGGPVIAPMMLLRREYADEIFGALQQAGVNVHHLLLHADSDIVRARIETSMEFPDSEERSERVRAFRRRELADYEQAYTAWLRRSAEVIDTSALSPDQVTDQALAVLRRP